MTEPIDVLVVTPEGVAHIESIAPDYKSIKTLIGGGYLEVVAGELGNWVCYGDEEGNLKGFTPNGLAAGLIMSLGHRPVAPVGTVVFVGSKHVGELGQVEVSIPATLRELMFPLGE